jgi:hypothetical protein
MNSTNNVESTQENKIKVSKINYSYHNVNKVNKAELDEKYGTIYRASGNLLIIKETAKCVPKQFVGCARSDVSTFSAGAAVRMRRYLRECMPDYVSMVTLTYPGFYETDGRKVKEHLRRFLQELKRHHERSGRDTSMYSTFWFLEFQERGAPHFHLFSTWLPSKEWVAKRWYEIVNSEDIRHLHAGTRVEFLRSGREGTIAYASKYAAKQEQKVVPENYEKVGRFWGVSGRRDVMSASTFVKANEDKHLDAKKQVQNLFSFIQKAVMLGEAEVIVREKGVLIVNMITKECRRAARVRISMIGAMVDRHEDLFWDAELSD